MLLHDIQRPKEMGLTCTKYNVQLQTYTHILKGVGHFTPVERSQTTAEDNNDNVILSRESRVQGTLFSAGGQHTVDIEWVVRHTNPKICDLGYVTTISLTHTSKRHQSLSFNLTFRTPSQTIAGRQGARGYWNRLITPSPCKALGHYFQHRREPLTPKGQRFWVNLGIESRKPCGWYVGHGRSSHPAPCTQGKDPALQLREGGKNKILRGLILGQKKFALFRPHGHYINPTHHL